MSLPLLDESDEKDIYVEYRSIYHKKLDEEYDEVVICSNE
jgi:hypothetical protein